MKNKTKIMIIFSLFIAIFLIQYASAVKNLCLSDCQGTPVDNPIYICKLGNKFSCGDPGYCQICVTDAGFPTNPDRCNNLACSFLGDNSSNSTIDPNPPVLTVINPVNGSIYHDRNININVQVDKLSKLEFMDMSKTIKRWQTLCDGCTSIQESSFFNDGPKDIIIRARKDANDLTSQKEIMFMVDTKVPKIYGTLPRTKSYTNGDFTVIYGEVNLELAKLFYGVEGNMKSMDMNFCDSGDRETCSVIVDLSGFDGQKIKYYFELTDSLATVKSRSTEVLVDITKPKFTKFNVTSFGRKVTFDLQIDDKTADIKYLDLSDKLPRFSTLCSRSLVCKKTRTFYKLGEHNLVVRAIDKAENYDERNVTIVI